MNLIRIARNDTGIWTVRSPYNDKFVALAKDLPGMRWDANAGAWTGYGDSTRMLVERLTQAGIAKCASPLPPLSVEPNRTRQIDYSPGFQPREYQKLGINFLLDTASEGAFLADGMGLGKTYQLLEAIKILPQPSIIVCPANVKSVWRDEALKLGIEPLLLFGKTPPENGQIEKSDGLVVMNYELVDSWLPHLKNVKTIGFDEVQNLTNAKSQRSKACKQLAKFASNRIAATGTPFTSYPKELWNIVDTISPGRFGKEFSYWRRYCGAYQEDVKFRGAAENETKKVWNVKGSSHTEELNARLKQFMLRRTKSDVKLELPAKTRQLLEFDLAEEYQNPDRWWSVKNSNNAQIALGIAADGKIPHAVDLCISSVNSGNKVLLFMHRKDVARNIKKQLAKQGFESFLATGDESSAKRQENAVKALANENSILIATMDAVGTGVNYLVGFDTVIFVELHYVPGIMLQAEDRAHRFGQNNPVMIYYLIGLNTIDEMVRNTVLNKLATFEKTIGNVGDTIRDDLLGQTEEQALAEMREIVRQMDLER